MLRKNEMKEKELFNARATILARCFEIDKNFVKKALSLIDIPVLECSSISKTVREAQEGFLAGDCCSDEQKSHLRRWVELAKDREEVLLAYKWACEDSEIEQILAIKKMFKILFIN